MAGISDLKIRGPDGERAPYAMDGPMTDLFYCEENNLNPNPFLTGENRQEKRVWVFENKGQV